MLNTATTKATSNHAKHSLEVEFPLAKKQFFEFVFIPTELQQLQRSTDAWTIYLLMSYVVGILDGCGNCQMGH